MTTKAASDDAQAAGVHSKRKPNPPSAVAPGKHSHWSKVLGQLLAYSQSSPGERQVATRAALSVRGHEEPASIGAGQLAASALSTVFPAPSVHWNALPSQTHKRGTWVAPHAYDGPQTKP